MAVRIALSTLTVLSMAMGAVPDSILAHQNLSTPAITTPASITLGPSLGSDNAKPYGCQSTTGRFGNPNPNQVICTYEAQTIATACRTTMYESTTCEVYTTITTYEQPLESTVRTTNGIAVTKCLNVATGFRQGEDYDTPCCSTANQDADVRAFTSWIKAGAFEPSPSVGASSPCCGGCTIAANSVQVFYWPTNAVTGTTTSAPQPTTMVVDNFTMTYPTPYFGVTSLAAHNFCGGVGPTLTQYTFPIPNPSTFVSTTTIGSGQTSLVFADFDFGEFAKCTTSCNPIVSVPFEILVGTEKGPFEFCDSPLVGGLFDPPYALTKEDSLEGPSAIPEPAPKSTSVAISSTSRDLSSTSSQSLQVSSRPQLPTHTQPSSIFDSQHKSQFLTSPVKAFSSITTYLDTLGGQSPSEIDSKAVNTQWSQSAKGVLSDSVGVSTVQGPTLETDDKPPTSGFGSVDITMTVTGVANSNTGLSFIESAGAINHDDDDGTTSPHLSRILQSTYVKGSLRYTDINNIAMTISLDEQQITAMQSARTLPIPPATSSRATYGSSSAEPMPAQQTENSVDNTYKLLYFEAMTSIALLVAIFLIS